MSGNRFRILFISTQFPYPPRSGFETRVYQLARRIAARHDVTLLSYGASDEDERVRELRGELAVEVVRRAGASVAAKRARQLASVLSTTPWAGRLAYSHELQTALDELAGRSAFDLVQLESSPLLTLRPPPATRVVLDEHNIESEVAKRVSESETSAARRLFNNLEHRRFGRFERHGWNRVDGCAVTSEREERVIRKHAPRTPVAVVPNGVDLEAFRPSPDEPEPVTAIFNGALDYRPNLDAALYLVDEVWPTVLLRRPEARLTVVGRGPPEAVARLQRDAVEVTGEVPDVRPYLARAAVVVVPIRMGGGTRLKVLEGLAMGKPMVSTTLGCEGIDVRDGEHLLVADSPESLAAAILRLFENRSTAVAVGARGRLRMEQAYSWDLAATRLEDLYERVLARP